MLSNKQKKLITLIIILFIGYCNLSKAEPVDSVFTYEGYFWDGEQPADGIYDLVLMLYDDPGQYQGNQIGYINEVNDCFVRMVHLLLMWISVQGIQTY